MKNDNNDNGKNSNPPQNLRKSWQWTSTELKSALDHWEVMAHEIHGPSPDEKMLQDMQKLLSDLKITLDSLSK